jgi:release factor glutamine methyltransferase
VSRPVRALLASATAQLREAGVESPAQDARLLLSFVAGVELVRLPLLDELDDDHVRRFEKLIIERGRRIPLQHLTGRAHFRHTEVQVGPGGFIPRPETEVMTGWAIDALTPMITLLHRPLVVELCAGSGAIAKAIAGELTRVDLHAVELSEEAAVYARRNLAETLVELHVGDMATALPELDGTVDLVIANPPYIPLDAYESVAVEVRDHDPTVALFSGDDGLDAIRVVVEVAARLLRPAGLLCFEHADLQGESAPAVSVASGAFTGVRDHRDLTGRPRFVTAVRNPR